MPLFLFVSRDTSQAKSCSNMGTCRYLGGRWLCSPQLLVTSLLDPDGCLKSAEGALHLTPCSWEALCLEHSLYSFGITGAVIRLLCMGQCGKNGGTLDTCFLIPFLHLLTWIGVMVSLSCSLAVLGIEFRASCLLDKHFTTELHYQLPSSFLILRQSLN